MSNNKNILYISNSHPSYDICENVSCPKPIFQIHIWRGRKFKDNTNQYQIYLSVPSADSHETITLGKIRGTLEEARAYTANLLGFDTVEVKQDA